MLLALPLAACGVDPQARAQLRIAPGDNATQLLVHSEIRLPTQVEWALAQGVPIHLQWLERNQNRQLREVVLRFSALNARYVLQEAGQPERSFADRESLQEALSQWVLPRDGKQLAVQLRLSRADLPNALRLRAFLQADFHYASNIARWSAP
jgi:Domain of unknown function (DUF4390)